MSLNGPSNSDRPDLFSEAAIEANINIGKILNLRSAGERAVVITPLNKSTLDKKKTDEDHFNEIEDTVYALAGLSESGGTAGVDIILDLSQLASYNHSIEEMITMLAKSDKRMQAGGRLILAAPTEALHENLKQKKLDQVATIVSSISEAKDLFDANGPEGESSPVQEVLNQAIEERLRIKAEKRREYFRSISEAVSSPKVPKDIETEMSRQVAHDDAVILEVKVGQLDSSMTDTKYKEFQKDLELATERAAELGIDLAVDLSNVTYANASNLGLLILASKKCVAQGITMVLTNTCEKVREPIKRAGMEAVLNCTAEDPYRPSEPLEPR